MLVVEVTNTKNFREPLSRVYKSVNKKNIPLEQCILLDAREGDGLYLTALDSGKHQMTLRVPDAQVFESGMALVRGEVLYELAGTLNDTALSLHVDEGEACLVMRCGNAIRKPSLYGESPEVFVEKLLPLPEVVGRLDSEELVEAVKSSLKLAPKGSFMVFKGSGQDVQIYATTRNRIFSMSRLENRDLSDPWSIGVHADLVERLPNFVGEALIHLDQQQGQFAISVGDEHLLIRLTMEDQFSRSIDELVNQQENGYWIAKLDALMQDLRAAMIIKDRAGISITLRGQGLYTACKAHGRGSVSTTHRLVDVVAPLDESGQEMDLTLNFDPAMLMKTLEALGGVDVLAEILTVVMPGWNEGDPDEVFHNLRFMNADKPDAHKVVVASLAVGEEVEDEDEDV